MSGTTAFRSALGRIVACGCVIAPLLAHGQGAPNFPSRGLDPATRIEQLGEDVRQSFDSTLSAYDEASRQRPHDVVVRRQQCEFIDQFTYIYEYVDWLDEVYSLGEQCVARFGLDFPEHPEAVLMELGRQYGEALLAAGWELDRSARFGWTEGQNARLYTMLATAADLAGDPNAGYFAARALEFDDNADVRLILASSLVSAGDLDRARSLLTSPMTRDDLGDPWRIAGNMRLLAQVGEAERVQSMYDTLQRDGAYYSHYEVALALRDAGAIELARDEFRNALETDTYTTDDERAWFEFEYEFGTGAQALDAYSRWRETGWAADPLGINRVSLLIRDPSLPWTARDLLALLGAVGAIGCIGLFALVPLTIPHYRGLVRRARHGQPYPADDGWQLRHAWFGLFAFGLASLIAAYFGGPVDITAGTVSSWDLPFGGYDIARVAMLESFLAIAFLLPLGRISADRQPHWWGSAWSLRKSLLIGAAAAFALRLPLFPVLLVPSEAVQPFLRESELWQMLLEVQSAYGMAGVLWLIAILAPVIEEFLFRGVLLGAFSRHISFGWANVIQAAVFAGLHMDSQALAYLFVMGLVAGGLAKRSGGLAAPIAFHLVFNAVGGILLLR